MVHKTIHPCIALLALLVISPADALAQEVKLTKLDGKVRVEIDGKLFTEYRHADLSRPVLYPVIGPTGAAVTRKWPIEKGEPDEATDHPHHKSIWYTHGDVNGVDFWSESKNAGQIKHDKLIDVQSGSKVGSLKAAHKWLAKDGKVICTDEQTIRFHALGAARAIDYEITIHASNGRVVFGDTKEGTMGVRTHPALRLTAKNRKEGAGHAVNSEGDKDKDLWGKAAKWVDYWGPIDGKTVGIAIFDHPTNPRHPTTWHARDYGLVAANPFGLHDFSRGKLPKQAGNLTIESGKSVTFKYRIYLHEGDAQSADVAGAYNAYAAEAKQAALPASPAKP